MMKTRVMRYFSPAENTNEGWEKYSLPIGNGFCGAGIFGGVSEERVQFTTNEFAGTYSTGGVSDFAELWISSPEGEVKNYERTLDLSSGIASSAFCKDGVCFKRSAFYSYPDRVFVYQIQTDAPADYDASLLIPYLGTRTPEEGGRTGTYATEGSILCIREELPMRELKAEARLAVTTDGVLTASDGKLCITGAKETVFYYTMGTSYRLCPEVFLDGCHKALGDDPHERVCQELYAATEKGYDLLLRRHIADYAGLMGRAELDLGGVDDGRATDALLESFRSGNNEPYLIETYFTFGRHLLVSSSRKGSLPASLQGVWTVHDKSPWGSGFWHNINIQMNYWPAFSTNLAETFDAYADYYKAYREQAERNAEEWLFDIFGKSREKGKCGWMIGTGAYAYEIEGVNANTHSGPGTGALTAKMFWDAYDFTRDPEILKDVTYPAVHGMSEFLTKCVKDYGGRYLCAFSASPEQIIGSRWNPGRKRQLYYHTVGCSFDQQMIYENAKDDIECAKLLGISDETTEREHTQISAYEPVRIGWSGQIKEFDEERFYGEIGEGKHRHISQLVGLMPGTSVTGKTPAWLDAARITLTHRGDESTGWALAHRFCSWARVGDGDHAYLLLSNLLKMRTHPNLWDVHPPFQIDGNFGAVAGIAEMLLQSHDGVISLIPALPSNWKNLSFRGLKARGNFTVSLSVKEGVIERCTIDAPIGGKIRLRAPGCSEVSVTDQAGKSVTVSYADGILEWETNAGFTYTLSDFRKEKVLPKPETVHAKYAEHSVSLAWKNGGCSYAIYRAKDSDPAYELVGTTNGHTYEDTAYSETNRGRLTYKVIPFEGEIPSSDRTGALAVLHPGTVLDDERYALIYASNNLADGDKPKF